MLTDRASLSLCGGMTWGHTVPDSLNCGNEQISCGNTRPDQGTVPARANSGSESQATGSASRRTLRAPMSQLQRKYRHNRQQYPESAYNKTHERLQFEFVPWIEKTPNCQVCHTNQQHKFHPAKKRQR